LVHEWDVGVDQDVELDLVGELLLEDAVDGEGDVADVVAGGELVGV